MIFIRPLILLLLFVPFLFQLVKHQKRKRSSWTKWVDKALLPHLLVKSNQTKASHLNHWFMVLLWSLAVFAAAGPAFEKLPVPVSHDLPNTVIIFDLGPAMQNNTLTQAKLKMHDLLTALKGNRIALVLYADKGYVALPLTQDRALLRSLIPTLDPSVLPSGKHNLASAFQTANTLLDQVGGKGRILYLTAGATNTSGIQTNYPVGVLGFDDTSISPSLKSIGIYQKKTSDATDVLTLLKKTEPSTTLSFDEESTTDQWADLAPYLALILLPFLILTFKRGFLFFLIIGIFTSAQASFFLRPDQEAYLHHQEAVKNYRSGNYEQAVQGFRDTPYNLGNALAHTGKIQEAIQAYATALKENPNDEDAAFNKEYLEKQLPPPEENQQPQQQEQQSNQNKQDQEENSSQNKQENEANEEQQENNNSEQNDQQQQSAQPEDQQQAEQTQPQEVDDKDKEQSPFNQQEQQVLNRLRSDPYRVLRYRIQQQARQK